VALLATFRLVPLLLLRIDVHARSLPAPLQLLVAGVTGVAPNQGAVPGSSAMEQIAGGIGFWALVLSVVGLVVGAATWALGSHSSNYQYASAGRRAVVASGLAALLIGAAQAIINFFFHAGSQVHQ
jgi:Family of unknown function (DUF6112)